MTKFEKNEEKERIFYLTKNTMERVESILKEEGDLHEEKRKEALKILLEFNYIIEEVFYGRL